MEQLLKENHLRWDSLGEYLATAIGFQELGARTGDGKKIKFKLFTIFLTASQSHVTRGHSDGGCRYLAGEE